MDISGKTAIVTGGASGFGLAFTNELLSRGANVAVLDIAEQAMARLADSENKLLPIHCDVSDPKQVEASISTTFEQFGSASILINNVGIMESAPLINIMKHDEERRHSLALWNRVLNINLCSAFYLASAVADRLLALREKGVIVNIGSISARGNAGQSAYAASKAGLEAMSKVWAKELGPLGIRSGVVAPGFINTNAANDALEQRLIDKWVAQTPLRRQGEVSEVVSAAMFIIENDFFNGETISVNGGLVV